MKKKKAKKIAIHAELRKESQTFNGYLKYEITVKNPDGSIEKVPAYGKGLQDALSRVVHDEIVEHLEAKVIKKVPETGWAIAWFLGMALTTSSVYYNYLGKYSGFYIIAAMGAYVITTLSVTNWFKLRNRNK